MPQTNNVTWTVLPNGRSDGKLKLTVLATPCLAGGDSSRLGDPDYTSFHDWPGSLTRRKAQWTITFRASGSAATEMRVSPVAPDYLKGLNSGMWKALFRPSLPVRSRTG